MDKGVNADEENRLAQRTARRRVHLETIKALGRDPNRALRDIGQRPQTAQDKLLDIEAELQAAI